MLIYRKLLTIMQNNTYAEFGSHKNGPLFEYFMNRSVSVKKVEKNLYIVVEIFFMYFLVFSTGI